MAEPKQYRGKTRVLFCAGHERRNKKPEYSNPKQKQ
jgi:hypothetical protein